MADWLKELKQYADNNIVILLVGNKTDLRDKREVRKEDAAAYADQHQLAFIETSALDCSNVDLAFDRIINEIYKVVSHSAVGAEVEDDNVLGKKGASGADTTASTGKGPLTGGAGGKKSGMKLKDESGKGTKGEKKKSKCC